MTLRNRLSNGELMDSAGNPQLRDELFVEKFSKDGRGLTLEKLTQIRRFQGTLYDMLFHAANIFYEALFEFREVSQKDMSSQLTSANLAAIVSEEWSDPKQIIYSVNDAIGKEHREELNVKRERYNFKDLPAIQLFREQVSTRGQSLYQGNLYQAREVWRNFQPSRGDFLKNIRLPTSIGFYEAFLLGVFWADGCIYQSKDSKGLHISGNRKDFNMASNVDFYGDIVFPLLKGIHNVSEVTNYVVKRKTYGGTDTYLYPSVKIHSAAICTWLLDDLEFSPPATKTENVRPIKIPVHQLQSLEAQVGFFSGMLAAMGTLNTNGTLSFQDVNKAVVDDIGRLAETFGYHPSETKAGQDNKWYIYFQRQDARRMSRVNLDQVTSTYPFLHAGLFFNRKHVNVLNSNNFA